MNFVENNETMIGGNMMFLLYMYILYSLYIFFLYL